MDSNSSDSKSSSPDSKYDKSIDRLINNANNIQRAPNPERFQVPSEIIQKKPPQMNMKRSRSSLSGASNRLEKIKDHLQPSVTSSTTYMEPAKSIPIYKKVQVCIVGGGPAGMSAAVGAARAGADVMLVEKYGCFGGTITTVGMETLGWYRYEGTVDSKGIGTEMERRAKDMGASSKFPYNDSECLDAEQFKIICDNMIRENKICPLLHTTVVDVIKDGKKVKGIITESKSGRMAIMADVIVDCTGDADVAYLAGARCVTCPKEHRMGVTTVFNAVGVDTKKFLEYTSKVKRTLGDWGESWVANAPESTKKLLSPYLEPEFTEAVKEGIIPASASGISGSWSSLSENGEAKKLESRTHQKCRLYQRH